ncbi:MAG: PBSX family phage terminase large subunit [Ruminococcus sp.]|nr:PBSX family phage terminase large subunit [Ruminococcus sp.]
MIYKKLSQKQLKSMFWWCQKNSENYDAIICDGSVRSGKTMSMTVGFILWSMKNFDGENFAFCGKTVESLKRNVIIPMQKWLEGIVEIKINSNRNFLDISLKNHTNRYYFFGGHDRLSYKLIQGITLAGIMLDEVTLMPRNFVENAVARCSVASSKMWFNCNPDSPEHWFFKEWIQKNSEKNALRIHFTMDDNFSLSDEIKNRYNRLYSGIFHDRYIKGLWVIADGLVYGSVFKKNIHVLENYELSPDAKYYISVDYGTLNPCSMGLWAVEKNRAIRIKEFYYDGRKKNIQKTDEEYYSELERLAGDRKIQNIIIDPSASSFITTIRKHRKFAVKKARNDVINGIRTTINLLEKRRIFFDKKCVDIIREFNLYSWDDKKNNGKDTVLKENDHAMDDMRYFCYTVLRRIFGGEK